MPSQITNKTKNPHQTEYTEIQSCNMCGLIPTVCQHECILICLLAIVRSINILSPRWWQTLVRHNHAMQLSSHLCDGFQMTGPQDRPIWCGMTQFLFLQPGWEKQYRGGIVRKEFRMSVSGLGFQGSILCCMSHSAPSSHHCRILLWPPSPLCLQPICCHPIWPPVLSFQTFSVLSKPSYFFHSDNRLPFIFFPWMLSLFFPIPK